MNWKQALNFGTGIGIEIGSGELRVVAVRVRPAGVSVLGSTVIEGFRERPAAEWGAEYQGFLNGLGVSHLAATTLLPRREVIVRQLSLPGVSDRELGSAIEFQIDALHPYPEEEGHYGWARLRGTESALVGIARRPVIDRYTALFGEAGIRVASFTFSAAALYSAVRLYGVPPADGFLVLAGGDGEMELYGESPARPVFSAAVESPWERAASLAAAELRLVPESELAALSAILPVPKTAQAVHDLSRAALPYAAALAGACPWLALAANLLPAESRSSSSRARFIPTAALSAALLLMLVVLAAQATFRDRRYLAQLDAEVARLEPRAGKVVRAERSIEMEQARVRLLDSFRRRTRYDLDTLNELTRLVKPPAWVTGLEMYRDSIILAGEADQAAPLLKLLDASPFFQNSEFTTPLSRAGNVERFRIHTSREGSPR